MVQPRLRVIAGPNGSGKSSVFPRIEDRVHMGHYLNPDDLGSALQQRGTFDLRHFNLEPETDALRRYLHGQRSLVHKAEAAGEPVTLHLDGHYLRVEARQHLGYTAALAAGFIREQLVATRQSFTFESVLSDPGKLKEMEVAQEAGYRIYLYFVCTVHPDINVERVANRARQGGHAVPEARIRARYERTLANLLPALKLAHRAYLFDNSQELMELVLEADGENLHLLVSPLPTWVEDHLILPLLAQRSSGEATRTNRRES